MSAPSSPIPETQTGSPHLAPNKSNIESSTPAQSSEPRPGESFPEPGVPLPLTRENLRRSFANNKVSGEDASHLDHNVDTPGVEVHLADEFTPNSHNGGGGGGDGDDAPDGAEMRQITSASRTYDPRTSAGGNGVDSHISYNIPPSTEDEQRELVQANHGEDLDSYGLPQYVPSFPEPYRAGGGPDDPRPLGVDVTIPWNLRSAEKTLRCNYFSFLTEPEFWINVEFALRITTFAVVFPSVLMAVDRLDDPFLTRTMPMSAAVLASKYFAGEAVCYLFTWIRASCLWLPLTVAAGAGNLTEDKLGGWIMYYICMLFLMAVFTQHMVRRICLLLFNTCVVNLLYLQRNGNTKYSNKVYPCRVMVDWCLGTGFCFAAAFIPYPNFCKNRAQETLEKLGHNTATAFSGLVFSFWSPSNVQRNLAMSKVRQMAESLNHLLPKFEHYQEFAFYEFFFETAEVRVIRQMKFKFFERLRVNISSLTRAVDMVEKKPHIIDGSERSQEFRKYLDGPLDSVAHAFDELMHNMSRAKTKKDMLDIIGSSSNFKKATKDVLDAYLMARRRIFYEKEFITIEEFVPLMTFYLFTVVSFRDTVEIFEAKVLEFHVDWRNTLWEVVEKTIINPFMENVQFATDLMTKRKREDVQRVIEAAKIAAAMILTVGFTWLIDIDKRYFTGPNIIAFVAGDNPVEAIQASIVRLTGCLMGTVLGLFAGLYSNTPTQRIASLSTLMFIGTFLRTDKEYGVMAVYAMFVLIPLDSLNGTTTQEAVDRMIQNSFGIFIYLGVSILILPLSPIHILRRMRANILIKMDTIVSKMMKLYSTPLQGFGGISIPFGDSLNAGGDDEATSKDGDKSNLAGTRRASSVAPSTQMLDGLMTNRSFHRVKGEDGPLCEIEELLNDLVKRLRRTKSMMGFAQDERSLVLRDYPVASCQNTYLHMYHMTFLLMTMWLSWNVIRSQRQLLPETQRMLLRLQPIADDVARAFSRFTDLMSYMMRDTTVNLEDDLTSAVLELISATEELQRRKGEIVLMVIRDSIQAYRAEEQDYMEATRAGSPALHRASASQISAVFPRSATQGLPPAWQAHMNVSAREVTILPFLQQRGLSSVQSCQRILLPDEFEFPVSSEDAEGLHSFCLCLEMFSDETRLLMLSIGTMLDHARSKI